MLDKPWVSQDKNKTSVIKTPNHGTTPTPWHQARQSKALLPWTLPKSSDTSQIL